MPILGDYFPFFLAFAVFSAFIFFSVITRVGRDPRPFRRLWFNHRIFGVLYVVLAFGISNIQSESAPWPAWVIGGLWYILFQHPFFDTVFSQIDRGISMNICLTAFRKGGTISIEDIFKEYSNGKGVNFVKRERIRVMFESGVIKEKDGFLFLANFGKFAVILNRFLLSLWGLDYIGRNSKTEVPNG